MGASCKPGVVVLNYYYVIMDGNSVLLMTRQQARRVYLLNQL
jgi:hypothetical protein